MKIEIKVPQLPESVSEATLLNWHKKQGDFVKREENLTRQTQIFTIYLEILTKQDMITRRVDD